MASIIKKHTEADHTQSEGELIIHPEDKKRDASSLLAAADTAKIEGGNIKVAIRILSSEEKPAVDDETTYMKLTERHRHHQLTEISHQTRVISRLYSWKKRT